MTDHADIDHTGITGTGTAAFSGAKVYHSTTQSIPDVTSTAVTFDSEEYDTDAYHDAGAPTRLTVGSDGKYLLIGGCTMVSPTTPVNPTQIFWRKNGTTILRAGDSHLPATTQGHVISTVVALVATDYVELMIYQDGTGSKNIGSANESQQSFAAISFLGA